MIEREHQGPSGSSPGLPLETVLFDLDGTITDSAVGIVESYRHSLTSFGLSASDAEIRRLIGPPLADGFSGLGVAGGQLDEAVDRYRQYFSTKGILENRLYPGMAEILGDLASAGIRIGLATSKLTEYAERILDHLGVAAHFEVIIGSTRDGSRVHKEDIVGCALAELGQPDPSGVAMVGDREHDVYAALIHQVHAIGVTWGYGSVEELRTAGAHVLVDGPADLNTLLLQAESAPDR